MSKQENKVGEFAVFCTKADCRGHAHGRGVCDMSANGCVICCTSERLCTRHSSPESVLQEAHRLAHGDRRASYGHPLDDYTRTAALMSALLAGKLKEPLTAHEAALAMVCVKLSREMHRPKRDNAVDGAGYFWVAHACLEETARRAQLKGDIVK